MYKRLITIVTLVLLAIPLAARTFSVRFGWDRDGKAPGAAGFGYWRSTDADIRGRLAGEGFFFEYDLKGFVLLGGASRECDIDHVLVGPTLNFRFDLGESMLCVPVSPVVGTSRMCRGDITYDYGVRAGVLWGRRKRFGPGISFRITRHTVGASVSVTF